MNFVRRKNNNTKPVKSAICYSELSEEGILKNSKGLFSQTYKIKVIEKNENILKNILDNLDYHNREQILVDMYKDNINVYLSEIVKVKDMKEAKEYFAKYKNEIEEKFKDVAEVTSLNFEEKIKVLHEFYKYKKNDFEFNEKLKKRKGTNAKKIVAPYLIKYNDSNIKINELYYMVSTLQHISLNEVENNILEILNKLKYERILISINFKKINSEKILELVEKNIKANFETKDFIPYEFRNSIDKIRTKINNTIENKENLFLANVTLINIATSEEILKDDLKKMKNILELNNYKLRKLVYEQKQALNDSMIYGLNDLEIKEVLTTSEMLYLMPF